MKALLLSVIAFCFAACDVERTNGTRSGDGGAEATPANTPKPTPKPGEWRLKDYRNPLDQRPGKSK